MPDSSLELRGVTKDFGPKRAVDDLSLAVGPGEIFGLLGPNGAGKTTSLKILAGLLRPGRGTAFICGTDVHRQPLEAKALLGYVPDDPFVYELLTGREFLGLVANLYNLDHGQLDGRMEELITLFEAGEWIDTRAEGYSHGMRQKLVLAATLLHRPQAYLIDEPMVGLDPASMITVKRIFRQEAARGACLLISTHTLTLAQDICHRIGIISRGRLVVQGTLDELRRMSQQHHEDLENLYLEFTGGLQNKG